MTIRAIVVDDERLARNRLSRMLGDLSVEVLAEGSDGLEAIALVQQHQVDMLFIDINMPRKNGLEAAEEINRLQDKPPSIVFCTAYDEYALQAFKANASAYLLKPISSQALAEVIVNAGQVNRMQLSALQAEQQSNTTPKTINVGAAGVIEKIAIEEIVSFQSIGKHCYAGHILRGDVLVDYTLKELESKFSDDFVRSHRSTLVNIAYMEKLVRDANGKSTIHLKACDEVLPVSRRHLSSIKKWFE